MAATTTAVQRSWGAAAPAIRRRRALGIIRSDHELLWVREERPSNEHEGVAVARRPSAMANLPIKAFDCVVTSCSK